MAYRWTFKSRVKLSSSSNLAKLVQFYLWETPVPGTSKKGKTFKELGWEGARFKTLLSEMGKESPFLNSKHWIKVPVGEIEERLRVLGRLDGYDCSFEFAVHSAKDGLGKTEALFYLIRNGFAHGGFRVHTYNGTTYYAFESNDRGKLKGRAVIKESTLLLWMKIVTRGYDKTIAARKNRTRAK